MRGRSSSIPLANFALTGKREPVNVELLVEIETKEFGRILEANRRLKQIL
jgi:hypothetical protein